MVFLPAKQYSDQLQGRPERSGWSSRQRSRFRVGLYRLGRPDQGKTGNRRCSRLHGGISWQHGGSRWSSACTKWGADGCNAAPLVPD